MEVKIYANYGLLSKEKTTVFTVGCPAGDIYDTYFVEIPADLNPYRTVTGEVAVQIGNHNYLLRELLAEKGNQPILRWVDLDTRKRNMIALQLK